MEDRYKSISRIVKKQIPLWIRAEHPGFISFVEHYYKWLEKTDNVLYNIYNIPSYLDIDLTTEEFLLEFIETSMSTLPKNILNNKKLLIKHIKDVYQSKGTEKAIKFLFRILYNEDIEVFYPSETVLRCSDGKFMRSTFIKTNSYTGKQIAGRKIFGETSGASAVVENIISKSEYLTYDYIEISNIIGVFLNDEVIKTIDNLEPYTNRTVGQVSKVIININEEGAGYAINELIYTTFNAFNKAVLQVTDVDINGGITAVNILESGFGYTSAFNETNVNGKGANIRVNIGGVFYDNGKFITDRGKLSSICVLQDGYKNQDFSYVIRSNKSLNEYKDILYQTTHPAGMLLIAEIAINVAIDINVSSFELSSLTPTIKLTNLLGESMMSIGAEDYNIVIV